MPAVVCPSCRKKLHPPARLAGRRVTCPKCDEVFVLPDDLQDSEEELAAKTPEPEPEPEAEPAIEDMPLPASARLGIVSLILGVASILFLCLPFIGGYASIGLSGIGLLLALGGLLRTWTDGDEALSLSHAGGTKFWGSFGARARDYPLAGVGACVLALMLALLPSLFR